MNEGIRTRLDALAGYGRQLHTALFTDQDERRGPNAAVAQDLVALVGGDLAGLLSPRLSSRGRKWAGNWAKSQAARTHRETDEQYWQRHRDWVGEIQRFLAEISVARPNLRAPGNSSLLISRISRAQRLQKLETRIRRTVAELDAISAEDLVWNHSLPSQSQPLATTASNGRPFDHLHSLERLLRPFIERRLSAATPNWWMERVPGDIRIRAERYQRLRESQWPWQPPISSGPIDYLDFSSYRRIILENVNWFQGFDGVFPSREFVETRLADLEGIRNDVFHSREVTRDAADKLRIYLNELEPFLKR